MHLYVPSHALLENMFSDLQLIIAGAYMSLRNRCFLKQASGGGDTELAINILRIWDWVLQDFRSCEMSEIGHTEI